MTRKIVAYLAHPSAPPTRPASTRTYKAVADALGYLADVGSKAAPGFRDPEGIVVFLAASRQLYKVTLGDDGHKEARAVAS